MPRKMATATTDLCLCCGEPIDRRETCLMIALARQNKQPILVPVHCECAKEWERRLKPALHREVEAGDLT